MFYIFLFSLAKCTNRIDRMGLDQDAVARRGKVARELKEDDKEICICRECDEEFSVNERYCPCCGHPPDYEEQELLVCWRKHSKLHGWMEALWEKRGRPNNRPEMEGFNCTDLPLTLEDIDRLEADVKARNLTQAKVPEMYSSLGEHLGIENLFADDSSDEDYLETDLEFCKEARESLKDGYEVFYTAYY